MGMTKTEQKAKDLIIKTLRDKGYGTFAKILSLYFELHLTQDPSVAGYMIPNEQKITINQNLDIDQVHFIIIHEIMHEWLSHELKLLKHLAELKGLTWEDIKDEEYEELVGELYKDSIFNYAGDYDISNKVYTDEMKKIAKNLKIGERTVQGLVTDIDEPGLVDKTLEQMYDYLRKIEDEKPPVPPGPGGGPGMPIGPRKPGGGGGDQPDGDGKGNKPSQPKEPEGATPSKAKGDQSPIQIGGRGDSEIQAAEEAERQASIKKAIEDAIAELEEQRGEKLSDIEKEALSKTVAGEIIKLNKGAREIFDNEKLKDNVLSDFSAAEIREIERNAEKAAARYQKTGNYKFSKSLERFISRLFSTGVESTWRRPNPRFDDMGDMAKRGRATTSKGGKIPVINVYIDKSGSWDNPTKTKSALEIIGSLNKYVKDGKLKILLYYFSDTNSPVTPDINEIKSCGTSGSQIVKHIKRTEPDNIIIITDWDINDVKETVTVPGAAWLLFYKGDVSDNVVDHFKGKVLSEVFDIQ